VIYPWLKSRAGFEVPIKEVRLAPTADEPADYKAIKNNAELLKDAFLFYKNKFSKMFPWILGAALVVTVCRWFLMRDIVQFRYIGEWWENFFGELLFGMGTPNVFFIGINGFANTVVLYVVYRIIASDETKTKQPFNVRLFFGVFLVMASVYGLLYALGGWGAFILFFSFVCFLMAGFTPFAQGEGFASGVGRAWNLLGANFSQVLVLHIVLLLITFSFLIILSAPLVYMYLTIFKWNFAKTDTWINEVLSFVELFIKVLSFYMTLPIIAACSAYLYYSLSEIMDASNLRQSIERFGTVKQKYGRR
jgi:hypothetical protein